MRSLLPSLVAFLLAVSFAGCIGSSQVANNNAEAIPVPRLNAAPTLDDKISAEEWAGAHEVNGRFDIRDGTRASGSYDFSLKIGATTDGLHIALQLPNFPANPWNNADNTHSDCVILFFTNDSPTISTPSFSIGACAGLHGYSSASPGYWTGTDWVIDDEPESGQFNSGQPNGGTWAFGNHLNGTLYWEIYTARAPHQTERNGLHLTENTTFRLALMLLRTGGEESPDARGLFTGPHDAFPGDGYTPNAEYDATNWLRFQMPPP